ncbi:MAG TPA: SDR family NAD(P)-dependent oxidoreductase [Methylomirabilota bacterium]|nr:SDR family NAD(P)-dependent oxidoreductase [Methylomirabilota bacterium]
MRFEGRVVLVTGAARGIGRAVARGFAREGARVAALDLDGAGAEAVAREAAAQGRDALPLKTDVTAPAEVRHAVETVLAHWGRVDVLVNNAGGFSVIRRTEDIPDEEWEAVFRFNVASAFLCAKAVLPGMRRQRAGAIVNMSSVAGRAGAVTVTSHYAAAKAALLGFTRHLAREVARDGIRVNAVAPGTVATERFRALRSEEETRRLADTVPLGRVSEPEEIAEAVLFLASDAARYITGATLDVNGGLVMM